MGIVGTDVSMSLDGFITGSGDDAGALHDWVFRGDERERALLAEATEDLGAVVMGRRTFDFVYGPQGWTGPNGPMRTTVFVLTHEERPDEKQGETEFRFVSEGPEAALEAARPVAGDKGVYVMGANATQEFLRAGLLDHILIRLVPVLLGEGTRLFEHLRSETPVRLEQVDAVTTTNATHLTYRVRR